VKIKDVNSVSKKGKNLNSVKKYVVLTGIGCILSQLAGCTTVKEGFTPTQRVNLAPFADNTIAMLSRPEYGLAKDEAILKRKVLSWW